MEIKKMIMPETPAGYTRVSGYPRGSRSNGADALADKFYIETNKFDPDNLIDFENRLFYGALPVNSSSWEVNENQNLVYVTVNYGASNADGMSMATLGRPQYSLSDSGMEISIDKRKKDGSLWFPNYKTNHNHILVAKTGVTSSPSWWLTAQDLKMSDADSKKYKWLKEPDSLPDGWYILNDKTKNIETVLMPSPVVIAKIYFDSYTTAVNNIVKSGKIRTPGKTFGKTGQWLVVDCDLDQDGRNWVLTTRYQLAEEWDADYYISA